MKHTLAILFALLAVPAVAFAGEFVPLTSLPALQNLGNAENLSGFLNGLYRILIGVAAVLAILQLVRAGIMYMGGDSVTDKREARNLILMALFGLLLVLSPVIVFGIINPDILSLRINVSGLQSEFAPTPRPTDSGGDDGGGIEGDPAICSTASPSIQNIQVGGIVDWATSDANNDANLACCSSKSVCRVERRGDGSSSRCNCVDEWELKRMRVYMTEADGQGGDFCNFTPESRIPVYNSGDLCLNAYQPAGSRQGNAQAVVNLFNQWGLVGSSRLFPPSCVQWMRNVAQGSGSGTSNGEHVTYVEIQCEQSNSGQEQSRRHES